jgi:hypothetical protein
MTPVGLHRKLEEVTPPPLAQRIALGLMHATQVATPFPWPGWVYEEKVDGYRMAARKADDGTRLISRNGIQHTKRFPELVQALDGLRAEDQLSKGCDDDTPAESTAGALDSSRIRLLQEGERGQERVRPAGWR